MNTKATNTEEYIALFPKWKEPLETAQKILENNPLEATIKWGAPCYTYKGKNLVGLAGFKNHCAIWFHKGSLLKDEAGAFENAQPGKTKLLRQLRFRESEKVNTSLLQSYIEEAIWIEDNCKPEKVIRRPSKVIELPEELKNAFKNKSLKHAFEQLTPAVQREYASYIMKAKRISTKEKRLDKIIPMILEGNSLYHKYKK